MKIKGIDLYKRVLEEDETILGKVFEFDDMQIKVANTFGRLSNEWGLAKDGGCEFHIFYKSSRKEIDEIFKAEWTEVRQVVSFTEAVKSGVYIKVEHELVSNLPYFKDFSHINSLMSALVNIFSSDDFSQIILNGKWYIEN